MDEVEALEQLLERCRLLGVDDSAVAVGVGDDAAVLALSGRAVVSVDTVVDGVHADLSVSSLEDFGWRAMTTAVSDLAAMGVRPAGVVVAVVAPNFDDLAELYDGILAAAIDLGTPVIGGDVVRGPIFTVTVTALGDDEGSGVVLRSGARPGDTLFVTGPLGAAAAALRAQRAGYDGRATLAHRRPLARLAEGIAARAAGASAMCDCSDGLSLDLDRIARASGVGIALDEVPIAQGASLEEALGGGDDYELIIATSDPRALEDAFRSAGCRPLFRLGTATTDRSERTLRGAPLPLGGWRH
jgi:thiamine-monophosphate kinase